MKSTIEKLNFVLHKTVRGLKLHFNKNLVIYGHITNDYLNIQDSPK